MYCKNVVYSFAVIRYIIRHTDLNFMYELNQIISISNISFFQSKAPGDSYKQQLKFLTYKQKHKTRIRKISEK